MARSSRRQKFTVIKHESGEYETLAVGARLPNGWRHISMKLDEETANRILKGFKGTPQPR